HSSTKPETRASSASAPVRTSAIAIDPVAIGFVSDARSKMVSAAVGGASASNVRRPNESLHTTPPPLPTSTAAAGKVRAPIASSITRLASSTGTAHQQADRHAHRSAGEDVPRPRQRREHTNGNHHHERHGDPRHRSGLSGAAGQHAKEE